MLLMDQLYTWYSPFHECHLFFNLLDEPLIQRVHQELGYCSSPNEILHSTAAFGNTYVADNVCIDPTVS